MTDISAKLLEAALLYDDAGLEGSLGADMCRQAAATIEALQARVAELEDQLASAESMKAIAYSAGYYQAECLLPEHENAKAALEEYRDTQERVAELEAYGKDVTVALTGLTVGGSEFFAGEKFGFYQADITACVAHVNQRVEQARKLGAARGKAEAQVAVVKPLKWFVQANAIHRSESVAGVYGVYQNKQGNWTLDDGMSVSAHKDEATAKNAANKEEARRILSAITIRSEQDVRNACVAACEDLYFIPDNDVEEAKHDGISECIEAIRAMKGGE